MRTEDSRRLIVDACVMASAGEEDAEHPTSRQCRDFLVAVFEICHKAVYTPEMSKEWRQGTSRFARRWRTSMERRGKLLPLPSVIHPELDREVAALRLTASERAALLKDLHLIKAALAADKTIISWERRSRDLFTRAAQDVSMLSGIVWVDPTEDPATAIQWLQQGAPPEEQRLLRAHSAV
jgi:hypothetical protein